MNERDYGTEPILKLFFKCIIPAMVGMGFSAIYSIIDGIFMGHFIGHEALAAVNIVMPLVMITTALSDMIATGSSVRKRRAGFSACAWRSSLSCRVCWDSSAFSWLGHWSG